MGTGGFQKVLNAPALSREQEKVLKVVLSGTSVFFTGSAGTGKSFLLKRIIGNSFISWLLMYIFHITKAINKENQDYYDISVYK